MTATRTKIVIITIAATAIIFLSWVPAWAQLETSVSISPVTFELTAKPGEKLVNTVKVINNGKETTAYIMQTESFVGNESGQATVIENSTDSSPEYALKTWVKLSPSAFSLEPGKSQFVTITIIIPADAEPGGRYASVLASTDPSSQTFSGSGAKVGQKVGTLILLTVNGTINYKAYVKTFEPTRQLFERSPVTINTRIHNDSTVHIKPKGFITITNLWGRKVVEQAFEERNALPNSDRFITTEIANKLGTNRYTATLSLVYGDRNEQLISTTSFVVFPWKVGVPVIVGILVLLWFLIAKRRRIGTALAVLFGRA